MEIRLEPLAEVDFRHGGDFWNRVESMVARSGTRHGHVEASC